jgi:hypothetical protein
LTGIELFVIRSYLVWVKVKCNANLSQQLGAALRSQQRGIVGIVGNIRVLHQAL